MTSHGARRRPGPLSDPCAAIGQRPDSVSSAHRHAAPPLARSAARGGAEPAPRSCHSTALFASHSIAAAAAAAGGTATAAQERWWRD